MDGVQTMKYRYTAVSTEGLLQKGNIEANSLKEALEKIRKQSLIPIEVKKEDKLVERIKNTLKIKKDNTQTLLFFTENLYRLTKSGIPVDRSLKILTKIFLSNNQELAQILNQISSDIKKGKTLSEALKNTNFFPTFYISLIKAGEISGQLTKVLHYLALYLEEERKFKEELLSAILYPIFLIIFGFLAIQTIFVYVLPKFGNIFNEMGVSPPLFTEILIKCGLFWKNWGWIFLIILLVMLFYFRYIFKLPQKRLWLEKNLINIPMLGKFVLTIELAKIFHALAVTNKGGVTIEKSLKITKEISKLKILKLCLEEIQEGITTGKKLSILTKKLPGNFSFIPELISIGEETGQLGESFEEIAKILEEEGRNLAKKIITLIEPITILFLGLILGISIISILLAIFDLRF